MAWLVEAPGPADGVADGDADEVGVLDGAAEGDLLGSAEDGAHGVHVLLMV